LFEACRGNNGMWLGRSKGLVGRILDNRFLRPKHAHWFGMEYTYFAGKGEKMF
jgi:hypothetical protein